MRGFLIFVFLVLLAGAAYVGYEKFVNKKDPGEIAREARESVKKLTGEATAEKTEREPVVTKTPAAEAGRTETITVTEAPDSTKTPDETVTAEPTAEAFDKDAREWADKLVTDIENLISDRQIAAANLTIRTLAQVENLPQNYRDLIPAYTAAAHLVDRTIKRYKDKQLGLEGFCEVFLKNGVKYEGVIERETPTQLFLKTSSLTWPFYKDKIQKVIRINSSERLASLKIKFQEDIQSVRNDSALKSYLIAREYYLQSYDKAVFEGIIGAAKKDHTIVQKVFEYEAEEEFLRPSIRLMVISSSDRTRKVARQNCIKGKKYLEAYPDSPVIPQFDKLLADLDKQAGSDEVISKEIEKHNIKSKKILRQSEDGTPIPGAAKDVEVPEKSGNQERDAYALVDAATELIKDTDRSQASAADVNSNSKKAVKMLEEAREIFQKLAKKNNTEKYDATIQNIQRKIYWLKKFTGWKD